MPREGDFAYDRMCLVVTRNGLGKEGGLKQNTRKICV